MSIRSTLAKVGTVGLAAGLAFGLAVPMAAQADPPPVPPATERLFHATGSDTIERPYQEIADLSGTTLGSWDAFETPPNVLSKITPKAGGANFYRPAGSGEGVQALSASWNDVGNFAYTVNRPGFPGAVEQFQQGLDGSGNVIHETDLARSSSRPGSPVGPGTANDKLTYVPFARDAVTWVIQDIAGGTSYSAITTLRTQDLTAIFGTSGSTTDGRISNSGGQVFYNTAPGSISNVQLQLKPVVPQASSGTRTFFLGQIGVSTLGPWVLRQDLQENNAQELTNDGEIAPFSAAAYIAQHNGTAPIVINTFTGVGATVDKVNWNKSTTEPNVNPTLGSVPSLTPNPAFFGAAGTPPVPGVTAETFARDTYTVVPTANYTGAFAAFVDGIRVTASPRPPFTHLLVADYGFLPLTYTGTTGQLHSFWTN